MNSFSMYYDKDYKHGWNAFLISVKCIFIDIISMSSVMDFARDRG